MHIIKEIWGFLIQCGLIICVNALLRGHSKNSSCTIRNKTKTTNSSVLRSLQNLPIYFQSLLAIICKIAGRWMLTDAVAWGWQGKWSPLVNRALALELFIINRYTQIQFLCSKPFRIQLWPASNFTSQYHCLNTFLYHEAWRARSNKRTS